MSISSVSSSTGSLYGSSENHVQKSRTVKPEQNSQTGISAETEVSKSKIAETLSPSDDSISTEVSIYGDTVEISREGRVKAQNMSNSSNVTSQAAQDTGKASSAGTAVAKPVSQPVSSNESVAEEETVNTANLTQYSEYELQQMLSKGTISAFQYNSEIKRRERGNDSDEKESDVQQVEG